MTTRDVADKEPYQGYYLRHSTDQSEGRADQNQGAVKCGRQCHRIAQREPHSLFRAQVSQMVHWPPQKRETKQRKH